MLDKPAETFGWGQVTIWQNNTVEPLLSTVINQQELISSIACVQLCGLAAVGTPAAKTAGNKQATPVAVNSSKLAAAAAGGAQTVA